MKGGLLNICLSWVNIFIFIAILYYHKYYILITVFRKWAIFFITGVTPPNGKEYFIAAAFPSACGKTNLAMLQPELPGWKVRCVGTTLHIFCFIWKYLCFNFCYFDFQKSAIIFERLFSSLLLLWLLPLTAENYLEICMGLKIPKFLSLHFVKKIDL